MVGKIEEVNLRAVSIFTTAQLTAVPPYYSVDTSVDSVDSTMGRLGKALVVQNGGKKIIKLLSSWPDPG